MCGTLAACLLAVIICTTETQGLARVSRKDNIGLVRTEQADRKVHGSVFFPRIVISSVLGMLIAVAGAAGCYIRRRQSASAATQGGGESVSPVAA